MHGRNFLEGLLQYVLPTNYLILKFNFYRFVFTGPTSPASGKSLENITQNRSTLTIKRTSTNIEGAESLAFI